MADIFGTNVFLWVQWRYRYELGPSALQAPQDQASGGFELTAFPVLAVGLKTSSWPTSISYFMRQLS